MAWRGEGRGRAAAAGRRREERGGGRRERGARRQPRRHCSRAPNSGGGGGGGGEVGTARPTPARGLASATAPEGKSSPAAGGGRARAPPRSEPDGARARSRGASGNVWIVSCFRTLFSGPIILTFGRNTSRRTLIFAFNEQKTKKETQDIH